MDAAVDLLPPLDVIYGTSGESPQRSPESEVDPSRPEAEATPFYETHGRWTCMRSLPLDTVLKSTVIQSTSRYEVCLEWTEIEERQTPIISTCWDVSVNWRELYTELFMLTSSEHLRPLQGVCVPTLVGCYAAEDGRIKVVTNTPHRTISGWTTADPVQMRQADKKSVVQAYEMIHRAGVLHGHVALDNILIADDGQVCLSDFGSARSIRAVAGHGLLGVLPCHPRELEWELRTVKYLIDLGDARRMEKTEWETAARDQYIEYEEQRRERDATDQTTLLPDEVRIPGICRRRVDPRTDEWFITLKLQDGGSHVKIHPLSLDDVTDTQPTAVGIPLTFPVLLPPVADSLPCPTLHSSPSSPVQHEQPSPPPSPALQAVHILAAQRRIAKVDRQMARLGAQRRELLRELAVLEADRPRLDVQLGRSPTPPAQTDPSPLNAESSSWGDLDPFLNPPRLRPTPSLSSLVGTKRKAVDNDDDEEDGGRHSHRPGATSPVSTINDGSPKSKKPRTSLNLKIDIEAAQALPGPQQNIQLQDDTIGEQH